jgi:chaperone required for assembly of F1-ATPase
LETLDELTRFPITDQLLDVRRIDNRDFGQCGRQKRRASILADQTGNVIPHPAFKNGDGFVFHRHSTQESPGWRIANSAIDGVAYQLSATVDEIVKYAGADLVCYRAAGPRMLIEAQAAAWDSIFAFAREARRPFHCSEGVAFVDQPEPACAAVKEVIKRIANSGPTAPFALAALHVMTTITGSVLLALAVVHGELTPTQAWIAAHVDEDFEMRAWGEDAEALRRRTRQWCDMEAAVRLFQAVHGAGT